MAKENNRRNNCKGRNIRRRSETSSGCDSYSNTNGFHGSVCNGEPHASSSCEGVVRWRKILYEKQPFPDNYCSPEFLTELQKNVTAETYTFREAIRGSLIVMHQVNSIAFYVIAFEFIDAGFLQWHVLFLICVIMALIGYSIFVALLLLKQTHEMTKLNFRAPQTVKTLALYIGFGYGLSPVFKTLTEAISTDTIYALATLMFLVNIVFADYGVDVAVVSSALSLNAGIFGAVCLISRLASSNEVFSMLTLAVEVFVLWPLLRWEISSFNYKSDLWLGSISALLVGVGLYRLSAAATCLYFVLHLLISLVCPWGLMLMQPLKNTIHGPWDEAIVVS